MATIIYNHREMECFCRKKWKESGIEEPDFYKLIKEKSFFQPILPFMEKLNQYAFPEDYAMDYGMDTMRLYLLFEGIPSDTSEDEWKESSLEGIYKFLNRLMTLVQNSMTASMGIAHNERKALCVIDALTEASSIREKLAVARTNFLNVFLQAVSRDNRHSVVAAFMEYNTVLAQISKKNEVCITQDILMEMIRMLSPFAPFMSEYLWSQLNGEGNVITKEYPDLTHEKNLKCDIAIQVNGKCKGVINVLSDITEEQVRLVVEKVLERHMPQHIERVVFIPGKVYNIITTCKKPKA